LMCCSPGLFASVDIDLRRVSLLTQAYLLWQMSKSLLQFVHRVVDGGIVANLERVKEPS
jgi:hypothetical protein